MLDGSEGVGMKYINRRNHRKDLFCEVSVSQSQFFTFCRSGKEVFRVLAENI